MKTPIYKAANTKTIQEKVTRGSQSVNFTGIYNLKRAIQGTKVEKKVRVLIKRDSYDNQSYAKIQVWDHNQGWNFVTSLDFTTAHSHGIFAYESAIQKPQVIDALGNDTEELIELATEIIF